MGCSLVHGFPYFGNQAMVVDDKVSVEFSKINTTFMALLVIKSTDTFTKCYQYWVPGDPWWRESYQIDQNGLKWTWGELVR